MTKVYKSILLYSFIFFIALTCLKECFVGVKQLFWGFVYNNPLYVCGSFDGSGSYGGYLAVCVSLLVAYAIHYRSLNSRTMLSTILYRMVIIVICAALIMISSTLCRSAILALCCGLSFLVIQTDHLKSKAKYIIKKNWTSILLGCCIIISGVYLIKKPSADGRFFMNKINIYSICTNGWRGTGIGSFGGTYGNAQAIYFKKQIEKNGSSDLDWKSIGEHDRMSADCPNDSFNDYLFIGVERGPLVMFILLFIVILAIVISFRRKTLWGCGLITFAVFATFYYPLRLQQFQLLFIALTLLCVMDLKLCDCDQLDYTIDQQTCQPKRLINILTVIIVIGGLCIVIKPNNSQEEKPLRLWEKAKPWYNSEYYDNYVKECDTLMTFFKDNPQFLFEYGHSLNKIGLYEKSDSVLMIGTRISSDPMFWNVMGNNSLAQGKYREAEGRYKHAFYMVPNRLYPLVLLTKLYYEEGDTARFLEMTDVVENFVPKVESIRTEKLRAEIRELRNSYLTEIEENNED